MKRERITRSSILHEEALVGALAEAPPGVPQFTDAYPQPTPEAPGDPIDHTRAQQLILEQTQRLLPPADANALADHLLACDRCYRFAQDVASRERQRRAHT
jgi:hypothetical protein